MFAAWVIYPAVLVALSTGCGLLVDRLCGRELPWTLIVSIGLATVIVVATLMTILAVTAPVTPWLLIALAAGGVAVGRRRFGLRRIDGWPLPVAGLVYLACAAPVVLSGDATWLGYFVDNDPAFHFVLGQHLLARGRSLSDVAVAGYSSPATLLHIYGSSDYPVGTDVALAATAKPLGDNLAWTLQPFLAVVISLGAVAVYELIAVVRSRALRASCAVIAAVTGLVYAFYLEASLKELATAWLMTVTACLVASMLRRPLRLRSWLPLALAVVAEFAVLATAAVPWFIVPLAVLAVALAVAEKRRGRIHRTPRTMVIGGVVFACVVAIAIPVVGYAIQFLRVARVVLTSSTNLGNLARPLPVIEQFGIWPTGDFRQPLDAHVALVHVLIAVAFAAALLGAAWCVWRRAIGPLILIVGNSIVAAVLLIVSSPYAAAKVMMIFSVSVTLASMLGAAALWQAGGWRGPRIAVRLAGIALAGVLAAGVVWTDVVGYHDSSVAPRGRYTQLAAIGTRFQGQGPALINVPDEYAVWFLRQEAVHVPDSWGATVPRAGLPARSAGQAALPWDPNDFALSYLEGFRLLVLARSPQFSRPPANYRLVYRDRFYDVWRRMAAPTVLAHDAFTSATASIAQPTCRRLVSVGRQARRDHARLAFSARPSFPTLDPVTASHPPGWVSSPENGEGDPEFLHLDQNPGAVTGLVSVRRPGRYAVWLEGSISEPISVWVGRRHIGSVSRELAPVGQADEVGTVRLASGMQPIALYRGIDSHRPGDVFDSFDGTGELLGPLTLVPIGHSPSLGTVSPSRARSLCGRPLDWVEIVRG